jgi:hypothetical protein
MSKNQYGQGQHPTRLDKFIKKLTRIFEWIAEGQTAGALCKG